MKKVSLKSVVSFVLCAILLVGAMAFPASAETEEEYYARLAEVYKEQYVKSASLTVEEYSNINGEYQARTVRTMPNGTLNSRDYDHKVIIDPSDLSVVFRFYDDGSTAVYYTGESAAQIKAICEDLGYGAKFGGWLTWMHLEPMYLKAGLELGHAKIGITSTLGPYTEEEIEALKVEYPTRYKKMIAQLDSHFEASEVIVPVINYEDVPEGTVLTLVDTNHVEPVVYTEAEIAEKQRRAQLKADGKNSDVVIDVKLSGEMVQYVTLDGGNAEFIVSRQSLADFKLGYDRSSGKLILLDKNYNEVPVRRNDSITKSGTYYFGVNSEDAYTKARKTGKLTAALRYTSYHYLEVGEIECVDMKNLDALKAEDEVETIEIEDYPDSDLLAASLAPLDLANFVVAAGYVDGEAKISLATVDADGNVIPYDGVTESGEVLVQIYGLNSVSPLGLDLHIEDTVAKALEKGTVNVFLMEKCNDGAFHGVEYAALPVASFEAEEIAPIEEPVPVEEPAPTEEITVADEETGAPIIMSVTDKITAIPGDIDGNGRLNAVDVALVMRYIAGWDIEIDTDSADIDESGKVNARDVILLMQTIVG